MRKLNEEGKEDCFLFLLNEIAWRGKIGNLGVLDANPENGAREIIHGLAQVNVVYSTTLYPVNSDFGSFNQRLFSTDPYSM
ncbi:hypothetical protein PDIG_72970 [Penicillium digitatum PHI26]|uniref:Uncharacterized protein n=2 Tax=Penicillium digitatum TaxID=36651 RepID=K9G2H9_PEND2|nr:hypothetical protein PDIP_43450 [Penicillium digitatum Pd1]EKV07436.1 hypothetical protein PDIG_72970 [Penicillium digitatum PHI26]EKV14472.1 hypothetical protein PDIP_43450 [Penicillium digitatum Pd1]